MKYDVIVCGGGIAGVSAALASARQGTKTLLIEREFALGGLATLGLVTIYLPLCDGMGRQVSFSIAEELLRLSIKHGIENNKNSMLIQKWLNKDKLSKEEPRFSARYNANVCAILMEQLLCESGVDILYGTVVTDALIKGNKITGLEVHNKSGRYNIFCKSVVDCTGDADVVKLSNEETAVFGQGNVLAGWYYSYDGNIVELKTLGCADIPDKYKTDKELESNQKRYTGIDAEELSQMMIESHKMLLDDFLKTDMITDTHALTSIASIPQVRMTRRLVGVYELDDIEQHKEFDDSIGMIGDWKKRGPIYEIPFSSLHGKKIVNLCVAGRCISVTDAMWDITRVIPACAVTGEASGIAAALTDDFVNFDISILQKKLRKNGVILHETEL